MSKYLLHITALRFGGAERVISTLANSLAEKGHEVTLLSLQDTEPVYALKSSVNYRSANIKVTSKNKIKKAFFLPLNGIKSFVKYRTIVKEENPDVILAFLAKSIAITIISKILFFRSIPTFISERNDVTRDRKVKKLRKKILFNKVEGIICQSKAVRDYYISIGIDQNLLHIAYNPVDIESVYSSPKKVVQRKKQIIAIGRLSEQKNFSLLIEAVASIIDKISEYKVFIVGDGDLKETLEKQVVDKGLNDFVVFLGNVKHPFVKLGDSRLFVMTSTFEGFPNVLIEALASGIPTCTTDFSPGIAHELLDEQFISKSFDPKEFGLTILHTLEQAEDINVSNSEEIYQKFLPSKIINEWITILETK